MAVRKSKEAHKQTKKDANLLPNAALHILRVGRTKCFDSYQADEATDRGGGGGAAINRRCFAGVAPMFSEARLSPKTAPQMASRPCDTSERLPGNENSEI